MNPEQNISQKRPKFRVRFLLLPIPAFLGFMSFGLGFGCGLGGGGDFTCRVVAPSLFLGFFISVITLTIILTTTYPKKVSKIVRVLFTVSFVTPIILFLLPKTLPQDISVKYLEGLTPEVCATRKSIVPWGKIFISPDGCYDQFNMCEKVQDHYTEQICYARTTTFKTHSDCSVFKNWNNKLNCDVAVAVSEKDYNFCASITIPTVPTGSAVMAPNPSYVYSARHDCAMKVSGFADEVSKEVVRQNNASDPYRQATFCSIYKNIIEKDMCYAQKAYYDQFDGGLCSKISNTIPWFKKNCEGVSNMKR